VLFSYRFGTECNAREFIWLGAVAWSVPFDLGALTDAPGFSDQVLHIMPHREDAMDSAVQTVCNRSLEMSKGYSGRLIRIITIATDTDRSFFRKFIQNVPVSARDGGTR
jgi:hypothetical protein